MHPAQAGVSEHVWSYDFVHCRADGGKTFRTLNILDEFGRECLAIRLMRKLNSNDMINILTDLFILRGPPAYVRSNNGPEFVARAVRDWIAAVGAKTAYIEPGSPWEQGYVESFNAGSGTSCSTGKSSTRQKKPRSSSKVGESSVTPNDRLRSENGLLQDINRGRLCSSCPHLMIKVA